jgi:phage terminase large subunit-like protein
LQVAGDETTDYDAVRTCITEAARRFDLRLVSYDPWNAAQLAAKLKGDRIKVAEFIQGPKSFHPTMRALEEHYLSGRLRHGGDPVLAWCASNLVARRDTNENMAPDRRRSTEKIDDVVGLLMAIGGTLAPAPKKPSLHIIGG